MSALDPARPGSPGASTGRPWLAPGDDPAARLHALVAIAKVVASAEAFEDVLRLTAAEARAALGAASLSLSVWERDRGWLRVLLNVGDLAEQRASRRRRRGLHRHRLLLHRGPARRPALRPAGRRRPVPPPATTAAVVALLKTSARARAWASRSCSKGGSGVSCSPRATPGTGRTAPRTSTSPWPSPARSPPVPRRSSTWSAWPGWPTPTSSPGLRTDGPSTTGWTPPSPTTVSSATSVSLVIADVNGLKRINDDRGHEAGDRALVHFAGLLSASAGLVPGSLAGRLSGDEFCIVVEGAAADHAVWVAEDLCRRASAGLDEGVACGVASTGDPVGLIDTPARLFRLADAAQTRAKRSRSRGPVVAGRGLPRDATVRLADVRRSPSDDRRRVRSRGAIGPASASSTTSWPRSTTARRADLRGRLEVVADAVSRLVDAASWWVSYVPPGSTSLVSVGFSAIRVSAGQPADGDAPDSAAGQAYDLGDYPDTAHAVERRRRPSCSPTTRSVDPGRAGDPRRRPAGRRT